MNDNEKLDALLDALDAHDRLAELEGELRDVHERVLSNLDELNAVEILRAHVPAHQRWLLDRLELALRRIDWLDEAITDAEIECEMEEGNPPGAA